MMTTTSARSLEHLPISAFASVMGLAGTAVVWERAHDVFGVSPLIGEALAWTALAVFAFVGAVYLLKWRRHPSAVRSEWRHPVKMAFAPAITIALLVLSATMLQLNPDLSAVLWWAGAVGQAAITINTVRIWIADTHFEIAHVNPAWFIPAVGNLVAPLAGVTHASAQVNWFFFGAGMIYWLTLLPLVMGRLILGAPLPPRLIPTLAILMSPPAVGALAWVRLGGSWDDPLASVLLGVAVFQAVLLAVQWKQWRRAPFAMSAWAYTFPMAALVAALLSAYGATGSGLDRWLGLLGLVVLTSVVVGVSARSALAIRRGEFIMPEPAPAPAQK